MRGVRSVFWDLPSRMKWRRSLLRGSWQEPWAWSPEELFQAGEDELRSLGSRSQEEISNPSIIHPFSIYHPSIMCTNPLEVASAADCFRCWKPERTYQVSSCVCLTTLLFVSKQQTKGCQSATLQQVESLCCNMIFSLMQLWRTTPTPLHRSRVSWLTPGCQPDGCVLTSNWKNAFFLKIHFVKNISAGVFGHLWFIS